MSTELTDLDEIDIDAIEHSSEVITAVRTVQQSQVQLNVLADQKANINIGFTLLFMSLSQSSMVADAATEGLTRWGVVLVTVLIAISLTLALLEPVPFPTVSRRTLNQAGLASMGRGSAMSMSPKEG